MAALRFENSSTYRNMSSLVELINDRGVELVALFASPRGSEESAESDGAHTNFPLVSALVDYKIPGYGSVSIVFDGLFLTAARDTRASEVSCLLDAAVKSEKVQFGSSPFTSALDPDAAAAVLRGVSLQALNRDTRSDYWRLLSYVPEPLEG